MINFNHHINPDGKPDLPSRKKPIYPIGEELRSYLVKYGREVKLPFGYRDLQRFTYTIPLKDKHGKETAWEKVSYDMHEWTFLRENLVKVYAILKTEGDMSYIDHLDVARIDYCFFGNSQPFRIRIVNKFNDNYDHYYIKQADASRVYGLELEHMLSPNRMVYFTCKETLIEEHIPGIPGDIFIADYLNDKHTNQIRLAKEFVKFNERCFVHLLGDMRAYNQFFKENQPFVKIVMKHLNPKSIEQYQAEEKTMMTFRLVSSRYRIKELLDIMESDAISKPEKIKELRESLAAHFGNEQYLKAITMGQLLKTHLKQALRKLLKHVTKTRNKEAD
ncbi:MAG: hypothetical protein FD183_417 [Chitinophagaceae bacterium]|nr:MAG: hypothetical protein FD183_417 [Chitinophagaceae bacterium]